MPIPPRLMLPKLSMKLTNANELTILIRGFPEQERRLAQKAGKDLAKRYLQLLKQAVLKHIKMGMGWEPLSPTTVRLHGAHHILRLTGDYYRMLRIKQTGTGGTFSFEIGGLKEDMHVRADTRLGFTSMINMEKLANILELGNPGNKLFGNPAPIPARPHHGPAQRFFASKEAEPLFDKICEEWMDKYWRNR